MTNSFPPEPPESSQPRSPQPRRPAVSFDELVAIIVAFTSIGAILFWTLGKQAKQIVPEELVPQELDLPGVLGIPSSPDDSAQPDSSTGELRQQPAIVPQSN